MSEKIVNLKESLEDAMEEFKAANSDGATLKFALGVVVKALAMKTALPFRYTWIRLFGTKKADRYFANKEVLDFEEKKNGGQLSYIQACKLARKYTDSIYAERKVVEKSARKLFNSLAADKALNRALDNATDYSQDANVVEINYKRPTGLFGKKGGYGN